MLPVAVLMSVVLLGDVEATSLLGAPLHRPEIPDERRAALEAELARARAVYDADPRDEDAAIWYGRRLAYVGRYRDAIDVFTAAIEHHPRSFKLLRHRGHRYITVRELDQAIADLSRAAELSTGAADELEPDGAPNSRNIPRSTSLSNIWYHLALAHYLKGDFAAAADACERCMEYARVNDDMRVATSYWLYLSLRRAGRDAEAKRVLEPIVPRMEIMENHAYHRLLLMFKGELTEGQVHQQAEDDPIASATIGYGTGAWRLVHGDRAAARDQFERVLAAGAWPAFAHIAAEAELARDR